MIISLRYLDTLSVLGYHHEISVDLLMPHKISAYIEYDNCGQILGYFISAVLIILDPLKIFVPNEVLSNIMSQITPLMPHEISVDLVLHVYNIRIQYYDKIMLSSVSRFATSCSP